MVSYLSLSFVIVLLINTIAGQSKLQLILYVLFCLNDHLSYSLLHILNLNRFNFNK